MYDSASETQDSGASDNESWSGSECDSRSSSSGYSCPPTAAMTNSYEGRHLSLQIAHFAVWLFEV